MPTPITRRYPHGTAGDRQRQRDVIDLVNNGRTWAEIAEAIGYTTSMGARTAYRRARASLDPRVPSNRKFGVEIEFYANSHRAVRDALIEAGVDVQSPGYTHTTTSYWKLVGDGSLSSYGAELVSPILHGQHGLDEVEKVLTVLSGMDGCRVDTSTGLHVHLDMNREGWEGIIGFLGFYTDRQDAMDMLVSPSRRGTRNSYCLPLSGSEVRRVYEDMSQGSHPSRVDRYRKINIMSYREYGTIEVRHHQGSLSAAKVLAWIRLLLAMAEVGIAGIAAPLSLAGMLRVLQEKGNLDANTVRYLLARASAFGYSETMGDASDPDVDLTDWSTPAPSEDCGEDCAPCSYRRSLV